MPSTAPRRRRVGSYAVCHSRERLLVTRLSARDPEAGRWTLPGGGLEFGEHPEDAVVREVYEETGLEATVERLLDVRGVVYPPLGQWDELHVVQFVYEVTAHGEPRVVEVGGSTDAAAWMSPADITGLPRVDLLDRALMLLGESP